MKALVLVVSAWIGISLITYRLRQPDELVIPVQSQVEAADVPTSRLPNPELGVPSPETITVVAVGDIMLGRSVNTAMHQRQDWTFPFLATADTLRRADIVFGNLESPFGETCPLTNEGMIFCADQRSLQGLTFAGFDVLSLANNHALNQGQLGLELSQSLLENNSIQAITEAEVEFTEVNGIRMAWLAFDDVSRRVELANLTESMAQAQADVVVVSFHWGWEYQAQPNQRQIDLAHQTIDLGADLILGHHPHWIQSIEEYENGVIFYSLGNFVFDQMWSEETRLGQVAQIEIDKNGVVSYRVDNVKIFEFAQPRWWINVSAGLSLD